MNKLLSSGSSGLESETDGFNALRFLSTHANVNASEVGDLVECRRGGDDPGWEKSDGTSISSYSLETEQRFRKADSRS
jgi:hypothetical protein